MRDDSGTTTAKNNQNRQKESNKKLCMEKFKSLMALRERKVGIYQAWPSSGTHHQATEDYSCLPKNELDFSPGP